MKSRIMYNAFLSYSQLCEYLDLLQKRDLIRCNEGTRFYVVTENGLKFINAFQEIKELLLSAKMQNDSQKENTLLEPVLLRRF
jgi:predicted transcriptional regulator